MSVQSYKNTTFLTHKQWRSDRPTEGKRRRRSLSLPRKTRPGDESRHKDRGGQLRSTTSTPSPRARRRDRHVARREYTRSSSGGGEPALVHTPKANNTHNKQPPKKVTLDARESRKQGPPTKDPVQHDLVDRFTPSRNPPKSRATKARSRRRVPTATRSVRPQKHERRAR